MAEQVRAARRYIADHESGRRPLSQRQLRTWQSVIQEWGQFEGSDESTAG